jgi:recombination protein RecA
MGVTVSSKVNGPLPASELAAVVAELVKNKGEHAVINGSQMLAVERSPTGVYEFDLGTGGGFPKGRYSIVYGPEGSGKTNLGYCGIAQAQRLSPPCNKAVLINVEGTYDKKWAAMHGVDVQKLIVANPGYGEEMVDMTLKLVQANDVAFLMVDSLGVVVSTAEIERSAEDADVGTSPMLVKRLVSKLVMAFEEERRRAHHPAVLFINQIRYKIGVRPGRDPERMPGGEALRFLSSLTVRVSGHKAMLKEVHPSLPAFMEVNAVIRKAKVPVTSLGFEFKMCLHPHDTLKVGQTRSWNRVSDELKALGHLVKVPKGWRLLKQEAPTLSVFEDTYDAEPEYAHRLQQLVVAAYKDKMFLVEPKAGAAK